MADIRIRSTDGNNADDGSTWALAKADLNTPTWTAGDRLFVSQVHAQSAAAAITIDTNGTLASPTQILGVNDSADPPTAVATGGTVTTTGASSHITINDACYVDRIAFDCGTSGGPATIIFNNTAVASQQTYVSCTFRLNTTGGSATGSIATSGGSATQGQEIVLVNPTFKFGSTAQKLACSRATLRIRGGSWESGTATPAYLFSIGGNGLAGIVDVAGHDFSQLANTVDIFQGGSNVNGLGVLRNCKLPASWVGDMFNSALTSPGFRAVVHNCDSGDTNYRLWEEDWLGSCKTSTTITRTGGASDGTTAYSWVIVTNANAEYPGQVFASPDLPAIWNATTGSAVTVSVEIALDNSGTALTDAEAWLEVEFLGTSGVPLATISTDAKADVLASATDQTTSSVTWSGLTTPTKQTLSVSVTPQEAGYIQGRVRIAKASTTVYVDPKMTVA